jgi:hypothetical protein
MKTGNGAEDMKVSKRFAHEMFKLFEGINKPTKTKNQT